MPRSARRFVPLLAVATAVARRRCRAQRADSARVAAPPCAAAGVGAVAAADHAAPRVPLFVSRSRLLAGGARPPQSRGGVHARRSDQHRDDSRIRRRRARGAAHRERLASSSRTSTPTGTADRRSSRRRASTTRTFRRAPRTSKTGSRCSSPITSSPAPTPSSRRTCGTCRRDSAFACCRGRTERPSPRRSSGDDEPRADRRLRLGHRRADGRARSHSPAAAREHHLLRRHGARAVRTEESRTRCVATAARSPASCASRA